MGQYFTQRICSLKLYINNLPSHYHVSIDLPLFIHIYLLCDIIFLRWEQVYRNDCKMSDVLRSDKWREEIRDKTKKVQTVRDVLHQEQQVQDPRLVPVPLPGGIWSLLAVHIPSGLQGDPPV